MAPSGLAWRTGEGRSMALEHIDEFKPLLEDPARREDRARYEIR